MICKIADFIFDITNPSPHLQDFLHQYEVAGIPEFTVRITAQEIEQARNYSEIPISEKQAEINACQKNVLRSITLYDAFFFHASLIETNGVGIAFTALSGTGKTTHTLLWQKLLGDKMEIINGDKPIIRFIDNVPYGYGTPWCGKERFGSNKKVAIKHLCFIERSKQNSCEKISAENILKNVFSQIFIPSEPQAALKTLELLDRLLKSAEVWVIKCNTDISAAQTAYNAIFKGDIL